MKINFYKDYKKTVLSAFVPFLSLSLNPIKADPVTYSITLTGGNGAGDITGVLTGDLTQMSSSGYNLYRNGRGNDNYDYIDSWVWSYEGNTYDTADDLTSGIAVFRGSDFTSSNWSTEEGAENITNLSWFHIFGGYDISDVDLDGNYNDGESSSPYEDGNSAKTWTLTSFRVGTSSSSTTLSNEWVQPYAAMQSVGLGSIKNNRDLVLAKAGECNNSGWVVENTDYCVYTNANNTIASVNGNSSYGSYDYANFNTSINVEKTINDRWKAGVAYGVGSSNLDNYNFSSTTASLSSTNTHYSIYGVKKVSDKFTLKGMIGGSDFDYKGNRNYSTTSAKAAYDTDGYTAEINGIWDIKKNIKNMKTPIRLQPTVGVAFAAHTQDGFSESGSGDLITIESNQAESLLFKTGISIDKQIPMGGGKWILVPSLALNYEMDTFADDSHRALKGGVTGSSDATTLVSAKTFGQHNGSIKVGADFVCTKNFILNLNAEYGLAEGGDEQSYGGGFKWQF